MIDWQEIIDRNRGVVWRTAYRVLGNHADAMDCLQDTFLAALKFAQSHEVRDWPALLQHLATARAIDRLRRRTSEARHRDGSGDVADVAVFDGNPGGRAEQAELVEQLREALAKLPKQQAEVYCLRCINDLSYEQIGEQLGISTGTVGSLLHRARGRLRALMSPCTTACQSEDSHESGTL